MELAIIFFLIAIIALICIFYVVYYNKLIDYNTKLNNAESTIDNCLREKYDILGEINTQFNSIIGSKKQYLKDYSKLKDQNITNFDLDRKLVEYMSTINQLLEDYPDALLDKEIKLYLKNIKGIDEKLNASKQYYNKYTTINNKTVLSFPSNIISKIHGIKFRLFFDKKNMNDDIVDDFKL